MVEIDIVTKADREHKLIKDRGKEIMSKFPYQYYVTKQEMIRTMNALMTLVKSYEAMTGVKCVVEIDKNNYTIHITIGFNKYKLLLPKKRGPKICIDKISDENECDVTSSISPYIGPNNMFFNQQITPSLLGYDSLKFEIDEDIYTFGKNELIKLI